MSDVTYGILLWAYCTSFTPITNGGTQLSVCLPRMSACRHSHRAPLDCSKELTCTAQNVNFCGGIQGYGHGRILSRIYTLPILVKNVISFIAFCYRPSPSQKGPHAWIQVFRCEVYPRSNMTANKAKIDRTAFQVCCADLWSVAAKLSDGLTSS